MKQMFMNETLQVSMTTLVIFLLNVGEYIYSFFSNVIEYNYNSLLIKQVLHNNYMFLLRGGKT